MADLRREGSLYVTLSNEASYSVQFAERTCDAAAAQLPSASLTTPFSLQRSLHWRRYFEGQSSGRPSANAALCTPSILTHQLDRDNAQGRAQRPIRQRPNGTHHVAHTTLTEWRDLLAGGRSACAATDGHRSLWFRFRRGSIKQKRPWINQAPKYVKQRERAGATLLSSESTLYPGKASQDQLRHGSIPTSSDLSSTL